MSDASNDSFDSSPTSFDDAPTTPIGLSDPQYAARRRKLFEFLNRMRAAGADVDLDIPAIAVIGWQSAGKSSLIEAISGITLPRASGTCTRCPTECQLSYVDAPWTCTVSLRFATDPDGSARADPRTVDFGPPIHDKAEVTERIRRAQRAILSPAMLAEDFLSGAEDDMGDNQISFSSNCIVLQISGRDVTDLNFIDLPGTCIGYKQMLIRWGLQSDIDLIRGLSVSYIKRQSCIILLTVACETDFINQGAHRLAQEFDPNGDRTIGVLTKPDRIPPTEEETWLPLIRGERDDTTQWFCVKCPNSQAIAGGITWEQARAEETAYFAGTAPWSTLDATFAQRLGTANLTHRLSDKLCDLIAARLPDIERELEGLLAKTERELAALPPPPSTEPIKEILRMIADFAREVSRQTQGVPGREGLLQQIRPSEEHFRVTIRETAPCFVPHWREDEGEYDTSTAPPFLIGEESESDAGLDDENEVFVDDVLEMAKWYVSSVALSYLCLTHDTFLPRAVTRELPNNYPFIVQRQYIIDVVDKWDDPAQELFKSTVEKLKELLSRLVSKQFEHYTHGGLKQRVSNVVAAHLEQCAKETSKRIEFLLKVEGEPSVLDAHGFKNYQKNFLAFYEGQYIRASNGNFVDVLQGRGHRSEEFSNALRSVMANLPKLGFRNIDPLRLAGLQSSNDAGDALKIMADVRAYFQVAYKRFIDNVPKAIDQELVLGSAAGLQDALATGLGLGTPDAYDTCARLLGEPPRIAQKRAELNARRARLVRGREELLNVFA
ncbi:P-loop containing nucleoside triphosphate hydrolase protein [Gloeopeniophorella convolvens]|nr:P-loop containing nucleoside triphosphate hydrolase protein [Gloeopeniophorella convolvens]